MREIEKSVRVSLFSSYFSRGKQGPHSAPLLAPFLLSFLPGPQGGVASILLLLPSPALPREEGGVATSQKAFNFQLKTRYFLDEEWLLFSNPCFISFLIVESHPGPAHKTEGGEAYTVSPAFPPTTGAGEEEAGSLEKESISHTQLQVPPSRGGGGEQRRNLAAAANSVSKVRKPEKFSFLRLPGGSESKFRKLAVADDAVKNEPFFPPPTPKGSRRRSSSHWPFFPFPPPWA